MPGQSPVPPLSLPSPPESQCLPAYLQPCDPEVQGGGWKLSPALACPRDPLGGDYLLSKEGGCY